LDFTQAAKKSGPPSWSCTVEGITVTTQELFIYLRIIYLQECKVREAGYEETASTSLEVRAIARTLL
jgi:hypothetical protein